jgi:hypothetical protein
MEEVGVVENKLDKDHVLQLLREGVRPIIDGHTIFDPEDYIKLGWPKEIVRAFNRKHISQGNNPKYWIDGDPKKMVFGVYALEFLRAIAYTIGAEVEGRRSIARGSEARALWKAIKRTAGLEAKSFRRQ